MNEEPPAEAFERYLAEQERADPDFARRLQRAEEMRQRRAAHREP